MAKAKTKTSTFSAGEVYVYSRWTVGEQQGKIVQLTPPSTGHNPVSISYSIPSGAKIKSAKLTASFINPITGISVCTLNGGTFRGSASVSLKENSGTFVANFGFKANGNKTETRTATLTIRNITLTIKYEDGKDKEERSEEELKFRIPPQSVCIYDQDDKKTYSFDGVLKIQHDLSLKIEEDPSKKKELYVNNARNEPDKVTLDIMMSDVYSGGGTLMEYIGLEKQKTKSLSVFKGTTKETRSAKAASALQALKESRHMLTVMTQHLVYKDMLLQGVTITQDDATPFGWQGQLTFQEKYEVPEKKDKTSSDPKTGKINRGDSSLYIRTGEQVLIN